MLGIEEVARDERFASNADRVANRRELIPLLEEPLRDRSAAEWMEVLEKHQIPCVEVFIIRETYDFVPRGLAEVLLKGAKESATDGFSMKHSGRLDV